MVSVTNHRPFSIYSGQAIIVALYAVSMQIGGRSD